MRQLVSHETRPAVFPAIQNETVCTYGYDLKNRLTDVNQIDNTLCVNRAYTFDAVGNRVGKVTKFKAADGLVCGAESPMDPAGHQVLTYNDYSQLTTTGYVYDVFGRVTTLPSIDTANQLGNVTFTYSPEDRILSQKQGTTQTDYSYDALGRRFQDKVGSVVKTVRHYADESDNPSWVSGTGTASAQVDIFKPALASNLNATRKVNGTTTTAYLNFGNLHGDTITSLELPTTGFVSGPNELNVYDEYGIPQTPELDNRPVGVTDYTDTTQLFVLNYGSLGQPQRETTDTGIQFMGARGYNPITGQFLTPDPIQGGNETPYNYPNDPVNKSDSSGLLGVWQTFFPNAIRMAVSFALVGAVCAASAGLGCRITGLVIGGISGLTSGAITADNAGYKGTKRTKYILESAALGSISSGFGFTASKAIGLATLKNRQILNLYAKRKPIARKFIREGIGEVASQATQATLDLARSSNK